jgi:GNAT superfamily N-acetyltransferase
MIRSVCKQPTKEKCDEPVAACEVCIVDGTPGIYGVVTRRECQRRGFGSAMLIAGLRAAAAQGCDLAGLTASDEGLPVYERLGFQVCGSYTVFQ